MDKSTEANEEESHPMDEDQCAAHYYFKILCFEYKVVSVDYFMDKMGQVELYSIIENMEFVDRSLWDSQRIMCLYIAQKMCRKHLKLQDIFPLPWDNKLGDLSDKTLANLLKMGEAMEGMINAEAEKSNSVEEIDSTANANPIQVQSMENKIKL